MTGSWLYLVDGESLSIFDVSLPVAPRRISRVPIARAADALVIRGNLAYVGGNRGLTIVDISDPTAPRELGALDADWYISSLALVEKVVYIIAPDQGLLRVDVSDPAAPRDVPAIAGVTYPSAVAASGTFVYVAADPGLIILDNSTPSAPRHVGTLPLQRQPSSMKVAGEHLVLASGGVGVTILSLANPSAPAVLATTSTPGYGYDVAARGDDLYVADREAELTVLRYIPPATTVLAPAGGTLVSTRDQTTYRIPPDSFTQPVTLTHRIRLAANAPSPAGLVQIDHAFDVQARSFATGQVLQPSAPYDLTIRYRADRLGPAVEQTLALYFWDGRTWTREPTGVVNVGANTITARPSRFGLWAVLAQTMRLSLPLVRTSASDPDLSIRAWEITQATQTPDNTVPLVAGRPAVVRVYAQITGGTPLNGMSMQLAATRNGTPLPGSPLTHRPWAIFPAPWGGAVSPRSMLASSFVFHLPAEWLAGEVTFKATVDPGNLLHDPNPGDNTAALTRTFTPVPPLRVTIVPVDYTHLTTGKRYTGPTEDIISDYLIRTYPVDAIEVSVRSPIAFDGNLEDRDEWGRLISIVRATKQADGVDWGRVYYGVIPKPGEDWQDWEPPIGGLGGERVGIGLEGRRSTAEHEIGHALGLPHAPCGGAPGPDPDFPYPGGSIGEYGFEVAMNRIWSPHSPDSATDFMGYCGKEWISDYNYVKLYESQRKFGAPPPAAAMPVLYIRANLDDTDAILLGPVYAALGMPQPPGSGGEYSLDLIDVRGAVLATYPAPVLTATEEDVVARVINITVVLQDLPW